MKIIIGATNNAEEFINNNNEKLAIYDNDRRKWGKKFVGENVILNLNELLELVKNNDCEIIDATNRTSALYFIRDICKENVCRVYRVNNNIVYPVILDELPACSVDLNKLVETNIKKYMSSRDYYKEIGNEKAYKHACEYIGLLERNPTIPKIGGIELTNNCNLACPNCPTPTCKRPKGYMDKKVFDECVKYIAPDKDESFSLHGLGEPLLHPDFFECLEKIIEIGRPAFISTNGLLLSDEKIEKIFEILEKGEGGKLYISFHTVKSVENWVKCVNWKEKNPSSKVQLDGQVLEHNSEDAFRWLEKNGITNPHENPYIRFITSHSFAGNVAGRVHKYTDIEVMNRFRNCIYNVDHMTNVAWDGRLKSCCLDSEVAANLGNIFTIKEAKLSKGPYKLCHTCDPDWTSNFQ